MSAPATLIALLLALPSGLALAQKADAGPPAAPRPCEEIQQRIDQRRQFLQIRQAERLRYPSTPTFSPYCMSHPDLVDCQLPTTTPAREDVSRNVGDVSVGSSGSVVEQDPVILPLLRQQRALRCSPDGGAR
jgi:hypothetical protein